MGRYKRHEEKKKRNQKKQVKMPTKASHPTYLEMVKAAIKANDSRKGVSRQAIMKYIVAEYKLDEAKAKAPLRLALKKGVDSKVLSNPPNHSSSYRVVAGADKKPKKKKAKKVAKKKVSKKTKKPAAKKASSKKKSSKTKKSAKKSTKKSK